MHEYKTLWVTRMQSLCLPGVSQGGFHPARLALLQPLFIFGYIVTRWLPPGFHIIRHFSLRNSDAPVECSVCVVTVIWRGCLDLCVYAIFSALLFLCLRLPCLFVINLRTCRFLYKLCQRDAAVLRNKKNILTGRPAHAEQAVIVIPDFKLCLCHSNSPLMHLSQILVPALFHHILRGAPPLQFSFPSSPPASPKYRHEPLASQSSFWHLRTLPCRL